MLVAEDVLERAEVSAAANSTVGADGTRLEHDVDDAGDRVGAVLRRGAVAQDLDPLDRVHGIALRSTPADPRPIVLLMWMSAVWCRRLPFTSTSTWSGPRPLSVAGRTVSVPSDMVGRGKLNDGASAWIAAIVSVAPVD